MVYDSLLQALAHVRGLPNGPETDQLEDEIRAHWPDALYPQRGMQHAVAESTASHIFLGGRASTGKTWYVVWHPTQFIGVKDYNCTYVRRDREEMRVTGGLWDEAAAMWVSLPNMHLRRREMECQWPVRRPTWKTKMISIHIETPEELEKKKGMQSCDLVFEEATGFKESSVVYIMTRNRPFRGCKKPAQCFLTVNPDRDSWVFNWVRPWVDPEHKLYPTKHGVIRLMRRWESEHLPDEIKRYLLDRDGALCWLDPEYNVWAAAQTPEQPPAWTLTYIEGSIYENRALLNTPGGRGNLANLQSQDTIVRERLLFGNWLIRDTESHTFQRGWFGTPLKKCPPLQSTIRSWDYSARRTYTKNRSKPDYTVGIKIGLLKESKGGRPIYIILGAYRKRCTASEGEDATAACAKSDGKSVTIVMQRTYGDEGLRLVDAYRRHVVPGYSVVGVQLRGLKEDRSGPFSAAAQQGRVLILEGPWVPEYLTECADFPNGRYDDQVDATSVGITHLGEGSRTQAGPTAPKKKARSRW